MNSDPNQRGCQSQKMEYRFLRHESNYQIPKMRPTLIIFLSIFQLLFIILYGVFGTYNLAKEELDTNKYPMFMDVHSMLFVGFGFVMVFLKRHGYGSVGFNFLIGAFVIEWALLVRGLLHIHMGTSEYFSVDISNLLKADYCAAAVLISFGAVVGKISLCQLVIMATIEVLIQSLNTFVGYHYFQAYDVGQSIYVHMFGAYFGLSVSKMLSWKNIRGKKESSHYTSDLFAIIGTIFLWLYWPSFNSALAVEEGQTRAILNTVLSISASCVTTFIVSILVGKGKLNMSHVRHATLAGGVAVGAIADMVIQPFGALLIGSIAGIVSTLGMAYITPFFNKRCLHDTCGVHNLHGITGIISGIASAFVAGFATQETYNNKLYTFYPSRMNTVPSEVISNNEMENLNVSNLHLNHTSFNTTMYGRSGVAQGGFQLLAMLLTLLVALVGGSITGIFLRIPIIEQIDNSDDLFDDQLNWITPEDFSLNLTEISIEAEELELKADRSKC